MTNLAYCELYRKQKCRQKTCKAKLKWDQAENISIQVTLKHLNIFTNANKMRTFVPSNIYNTKLCSSQIVFWNSFDETLGHKVSRNLCNDHGRMSTY